jgi:hypothetical protein
MKCAWLPHLGKDHIRRGSGPALARDDRYFANQSTNSKVRIVGGHHGNPALFSNTTSNFNFAHLGEVGRDRNTGDSAAVCLGGYQIRNLLDSLYQGYPVGYLIAWRNPTVRDL